MATTQYYGPSRLVSYKEKAYFLITSIVSYLCFVRSPQLPQYPSPLFLKKGGGGVGMEGYNTSYPKHGSQASNQAATCGLFNL